MTKNEMSAEIAALKAQIAALSARPSLRPSDLKILVTTEIPSAKGKWASVEITDTATGEVTKCFLDHEYTPSDRTDGAKQRIFYATRMAPAAE